MRLVVGIALVARGWTWSSLPVTTAAMTTLLVIAGLFLLVGLWTPVIGTLVALIEIAEILTAAGDPPVYLLQGTMGAALAMLGPGLWSIDAHIFGWKRVEVRDREPRPR